MHVIVGEKPVIRECIDKLQKNRVYNMRGDHSIREKS